MNKKEIVTMEFNTEEMNLLSEAVESLHDKILEDYFGVCSTHQPIGDMMYKTEDNLRELLNKINQNK